MIFITGGSGLIGSFVIRQFIGQGYAVKALRRANSDVSLLADITHQIHWVEGDLLDPLLLHQSIQPGDIVVHAAAIVSFSPQEHERMRKVNVEGTANVVNVCLQRGVKKLCFVSSIASLGRGKTTHLLDENTKWEDSEGNTVYAQSKYLAELEVWRGEAEGLPVVIVNPSVVLGPGDWHRSSTQLFKYAWSEHWFYPAGDVNFVDVRDVAEIIFKLAHSDITSERFILNAGSVSYRELFTRIATLFKKRPPVVRARSWMAEVAWRVEFLKTLVTGHDPLLTRETARVGRSQYEYRNDKVKDLLRFSFKELDDTLQWTCNQLKIVDAE